MIVCWILSGEVTSKKFPVVGKFFFFFFFFVVGKF